MQMSKSNVTQTKNRLGIKCPLHFKKVRSIDLDDSIALFQKSVGILSHFGYSFIGAIDVVSGCLLEITSLGQTDTQHVLLLTGYSEVVLFGLVVDHIYFLEVVLGQRVHLENSSTLGPLDE